MTIFNRNNILKCSLLLPVFFASSTKAKKNDFNVIIIFTDDQGYNDLGCYGSPDIKTPSIDKMAAEGLKLSNFYVSSSVSSASRAGLLTGRSNNHNGVDFVFWPGEKGMSSDEITIAESLKEQGYETGMFGKWHLGDIKGHMPTDQGFDYYYGIPYSNDMYIGPYQEFSSKATFREGYTLEMAKNDQKFVREHNDRDLLCEKFNNASPLFENDKIIEYPCDQELSTRRFFDKAINFIDKCDGKPFFAYITPSMPHFPIFVSDQFKGRSKRGPYGDAVEEIDWNVGRLLDYLDKKGLSENTLVIFSSDNGPWTDKGKDGGSAFPFRDGKFSIYEGGVRTPCILRWKNKIKSGVTSNSIVSSLDLYPTIMHYAGKDKIEQSIDGKNISKFLENTNTKISDQYLYVKDGVVKGVRKDNWIYLPFTGNRISQKDKKEAELFNIDKDINQQNNIIKDNTKLVKSLDKIINKNNSVKKRK